MHGIYAAATTDLSARAVLGSLCDLENDWGSVLWGLLRRNKKAVREERERKRVELKQLGELGKRAEGWSMYGIEGGIASLTNELGAKVRASGLDIRSDEGITGLKAVGHGVEVSYHYEL
jgi:oxygen-dependent protoporphyrinogen oxidase